MLPLGFIIPIDGNFNGYVKGIEIMWLEIGNEKAGHIFQVSSRAGSIWIKVKIARKFAVPVHQRLSLRLIEASLGEAGIIGGSA